MNAAQLQSARKMKRTQTILFFIVLLALIIWSSIGAEFSLGALFAGVGESFRFIIFDFLPPDLSSLSQLIEPALQTLYMSVVAMVIGSVVAGMLSFLAAATTSPHPYLQVFVRAATSLFRNIPVIIWTILLVAAFGLGAVVGTMSLILISIGMLTRSFAEVLEEIDMGAGRSRSCCWRKLFSSVVPSRISTIFTRVYRLEPVQLRNQRTRIHNCRYGWRRWPRLYFAIQIEVVSVSGSQHGRAACTRYRPCCGNDH